MFKMKILVKSNRLTKEDLATFLAGGIKPDEFADERAAEHLRDLRIDRARFAAEVVVLRAEVVVLRAAVGDSVRERAAAAGRAALMVEEQA